MERRTTTDSGKKEIVRLTDSRQKENEMSRKMKRSLREKEEKGKYKNDFINNAYSGLQHYFLSPTCTKSKI